MQIMRLDLTPNKIRDAIAGSIALVAMAALSKEGRTAFSWHVVEPVMKRCAVSVLLQTLEVHDADEEVPDGWSALEVKGVTRWVPDDNLLTPMITKVREETLAKVRQRVLLDSLRRRGAGGEVDIEVTDEVEALEELFREEQRPGPAVGRDEDGVPLDSRGERTDDHYPGRGGW